MNVLVISLGVSLAAVCIAALLISLRNGSLNKRLAEEHAARLSASDALTALQQQEEDREKRYKAHLAAIRLDISYLEQDLAACRSPEASRARLQRLLSKAVAAQNDHARQGVQPAAKTPA